MASGSSSLHRTIIVVCLTILAVSAATATAASLITGKDIKNGSITGQDIRTGSIALNRLSPGTRTMINKGLTSPAQTIGGQTTPGNQGENGGSGPAGSNGAPGSNGTNGTDAQAIGPHWGVITRNTIGSPVGDLRTGPFVNAPGTAGAPPFGNGSLGLLVKDNTEKVAFGNEVDFTGNRVADLNAVGFRVFQTGENASVSATNLPNITFEVDPSGPNDNTAPNYTSLTFNPDAVADTNRWSPYIDATSSGSWGLTGSFYNNPATAANCGLNGPHCTFAQVKAVLGPNATILSAAVAKGRDYTWQGAVDGFRVNDKVFDFEPTGVITRAP